jgi:hypothetical protein
MKTLRFKKIENILRDIGSATQNCKRDWIGLDWIGLDWIGLDGSLICSCFPYNVILLLSDTAHSTIKC